MEGQGSSKEQPNNRQDSISKVLVQIVINVVALLGMATWAVHAWTENAHQLQTGAQKMAVAEQIRRNDAALHQYLASGVQMDADAFREGRDNLLRLIQSHSDDADFTRLIAAEKEWYEHFAQPLITKRHNMDFAQENITQMDLTVFYMTLRTETWHIKLYSALERITDSTAKSMAQAGEQFGDGMGMTRLALVVLGMLNLISGFVLWKVQG